ncbi:hypothetical protein [Nonomuraea wenchangensis]|uniref:hypothetical protein n=1 Tax=Nonomuraea wenchangensis TaxID=568860 RepID=UPI0033FBDAA5
MMAKSLRLSPDGPHHDEYTCQIATALSESVRALNHATQSEAGVAFPPTIHNVLGCSSAAVSGLDQLLSQIADTLQRMLASGQLGDDRGTPDESVDSALAARLDRAFNATAGLHLVAGREG